MPAFQLLPITGQSPTQEDSALDGELGLLLLGVEEKRCCKCCAKRKSHNSMERAVISHVGNQIIHSLGDALSRSVKIRIANLPIPKDFADPSGCRPRILTIDEIILVVVA